MCGRHSPFGLCNGAMSFFQNSRPTSSARYDGNTSLSRPRSPHRRDWTPHIMSAQTQAVRPSLADFVFVQSTIRPTLFSSDVTGNPSG